MFKSREDMASKNNIKNYWEPFLWNRNYFNLTNNYYKRENTYITFWWMSSFEERVKNKESFCFACGYPTIAIDRAHIIPLWSGGSNKAYNLHNLCRVCHLDSEGLGLNNEEYWNWFYSRTELDMWHSGINRYGYKFIIEDQRQKFREMLSKCHNQIMFIDRAYKNHNRLICGAVEETKFKFSGPTPIEEYRFHGKKPILEYICHADDYEYIYID